MNGDSSTSGRGLLRTFAALHHRDFRYLWTGTCFISGGLWIQQVTLGWALYEMTGSSVLLGALNGLRAVPFLIFSPLAGVAADRLDRRKLMIATQWMVLSTAVGMGCLVSAGLLKVWHLFAFTLVTGIVWSFSEPVRQALIPNVVPREDLMNAVALNSAAFNFMKIIGPSVGGGLIVWFGLAGNFYVQSGAYMMVLWMIYNMNVPQAVRENTQSSVLTHLREGFGYVWHNPVVLVLMVVALVPRIFTMPYQVLMPIFQKDVLGVGPEGLGMLLAAPGAGALFAMLGLAHFANRFRRTGLLLLVSLVLQGITLCVFSQMRSLPLALVSLVAVGSSQILFMVTTHSVLQLTVPDALRGRVMSIYMLDRGMMPAGALLAGISAHFMGAPNTVASMGLIVIVLAGMVAWGSPHLRRLET